MVSVLSRSALIARRYRRLGVIGRGATGAVYRAVDHVNGRLVAVKALLVDPESDARSSAGPELLEREFELLASLRHPNIIASLDYARDDAIGPFFTMDLQAGSSTLRSAAQGQSTSAKIDLLVQLLHALAYLHRRGLVHRDLKPENALCARGVLKLIDLGLAAPIGHAAVDGGCGTLAYAAPEIVRGAPADERTDLYAFGVIAYEILTGRLPFDASSPAKLLQAVFQSTPDFDRPEIDPPIADVLRRLLARDPAERFDRALGVVAALSGALDRPLSIETSSTRQSFLVGASFVGRDAELEQLRGLLPSADPPAHGARGAAHGKAIVVTGASGAGKSRLLEELSVKAMVRGVRVLRGQAVREGARPYEPWRGVFRLLVLLADPGDLEAAVLAGVLPEVRALLGRDVAPAPELDPEATQVRLVRVVEALLRRCREPLLVVLEDLQWAGTESVMLFARLQALASELPLVLVASHRTDEHPNLPRELSGAQTLLLGPLSGAAIERLCASMLGGPTEGAVASSEALAQLVSRRSDGNPFLAVEVMRTLANEAGGLDRVMTVPLPEKLLEGGATERLVHRRVEQLSEPDRVLLRTAAVAGRELDLGILAKIHPDLDVESCAERAVEAAVLSSVQGQWWFAHDRLRDALIEALSDDERRRIHGKIAEAILSVSPGHVSTLAHHFGAAGDIVREKEFAARAGDEFLRSGAYHEAIPFLERARVLFTDADPALARATVERQLGESLFRSGQLIEAREILGAALATLGRPLPRTRAQLVLGLLREALAQLVLRARARAWGAGTKRAAESASFEEAIHAYTQLSRLAHHLNDEELVLYVTLCALNLSERGGFQAHHARLSAVMGAVVGLGPVHAVARFYFEMAQAISSRIDDPPLRAFVLAHRGYYEAGIGQWQECEQDLEVSRSLYDRIGDIRLAEESVSILSYALFFKGELKRSQALCRTLERSGEERVDTQIMGWGLANRVKLLVRTGQLSSVDELLARVDALLVDGITRAVRDGVVIEHALARGDVEAAYRAAVGAADRLDRAPVRSFMVVSTYATIADALLQGWKASLDAGTDTESRDRRRRCAQANRALAKLSRVFPIAEPARLLHDGTFELLSGNAGRACVLWRQAARLASDRELPFDEALALAALSGAPHVEDRAAMRERVRVLLDRLGSSSHAVSLSAL